MSTQGKRVPGETETFPSSEELRRVAAELSSSASNCGPLIVDDALRAEAPTPSGQSMRGDRIRTMKKTKKQIKLEDRMIAWSKITEALKPLPKDDIEKVISAVSIIYTNYLPELDGLLIACCEECGQFALFPNGQWPSGWIQVGRSRYGNRYQKSALAWHCPKHAKRN